MYLTDGASVPSQEAEALRVRHELNDLMYDAKMTMTMI